MYKKKKKSNDTVHITNFKKAKQEVQKSLCQAYWDYISDIITPQPEDDNNSRTSTKRFWTFIKHKKKDNSSITALKDKGTEPKQKADIY